MAESSWPSPSNGHNVPDDQYEKLGISTGPSAAVYGDYTNPQLIFADATGMQIKVAADRYAIVRGHVWWSGSSIFTKAIAANASGSGRIDLVVLRLSRTTWDVTVTIVQGTPGAGAPSSTQNLGTTGSYDLVLAQVSVPSGASTIAAGNVTYVAAHLGTNGQLRIPNTQGTTFAYVPLQFPGMRVTVDASADEYTRNYLNNAWVLTAQQGPSTYTPVLTATTTNPVLGTGSVAEAEWTVWNGKYCNYRGTLKFGTSGVNAGSGQYLVSIPFPASTNMAGGVSSVGSYLARDTSGPSLYSGVAYISSASTNLSFVLGTNGLVTNTQPFAWAASDYITWDITYVFA